MDRKKACGLIRSVCSIYPLYIGVAVLLMSYAFDVCNRNSVNIIGLILILFGAVGYVAGQKHK